MKSGHLKLKHRSLDVCCGNQFAFGVFEFCSVFWRNKKVYTDVSAHFVFRPSTAVCFERLFYTTILVVAAASESVGILSIHLYHGVR